MKAILLILVIFVSTSVFAKPVCEITEMNGGLTVTQNGKRISDIYQGLQNYVHRDLSYLISNKICTVADLPCEITKVNGGFTVTQNGKRISDIWIGSLTYVHRDLTNLKQMGYCQ